MNREERRIVDRYAYCLCLHVKPGAIFIGVINLAGSLLCGLLYLVALGYEHSRDELPPTRPSMNRTSNSFAVVIYMMCATVSGMLLYGVVKSRPSYLMPFFWIQLCDFFFSLPAFLTSLYSTPGYANHWDSVGAGPVHGQQGNGHMLDVKRLWPNANSTTIYTSSLLFTTGVMLFKGYFLCIVWKCYRYLKMKEMILPLHLPFQSAGPDIVFPPNFMAQSMPSSLAPPDYETATKTNAPPDYETAIRQADSKVPNTLGAVQPPTQMAAEQPRVDVVEEAATSYNNNCPISRPSVVEPTNINVQP